MRRSNPIFGRYYLYTEDKTDEEILEFLKEELEKYLTQEIRFENINKERTIVSVDEIPVFTDEKIANKKIEEKLKKIIETKPEKIGLQYRDTNVFLYTEEESLLVKFEYTDKFQKMKKEIEDKTENEELRKYYENTYYSTLFNDYKLIQQVVSVDIFNKIMKYANNDLVHFDSLPMEESLVTKFQDVIDNIFDKETKTLLNIKEINENKIIIELCDETVCMKIERLKNQKLKYT